MIAFAIAYLFTFLVADYVICKQHADLERCRAELLRMMERAERKP